MSAASPTFVSFEDYLAAEATSDIRHEWCDGVVCAMSRGTPEHGRLCANITAAPKNALPRGCAVYASDTMLWIEGASLSTYADASVVCGALETKRVMKNGRALGEAVTNPVIVAEVLSESTERYDRDAKFQAYKRISALEAYVLVSQEERLVEVYRRDDASTWSCTTGRGGQSVAIVGHVIAVDTLYD